MRLHLVLPFLCVATMVHAQPTPAPPDPTIPKIAEPVCAQSSQDTADPTIPKITDINEACIALSGTQLHKHKCDSGLSPRFFKNNQFDSKAYAAHRSRIEVIDYDGRDSARNPRIVVPRNVTDQDTVYLRLRGSPLQYSYRVSYSTSALPARELTVVAGAAPGGTLFPTDSAAAAANAGAKAVDGANAAQKTSNEAAKATASKTNAGTVKVDGVGPADIGENDVGLADLAGRLSPITAAGSLSPTMDAAGKPVRHQFVDDLTTLQTDLKNLGFRADTFATSTILSGKPEEPRKALDDLSGSAAAIRETIIGLQNRLSQMLNKANQTFPQFDADAGALRKRIEGYQAALRAFVPSGDENKKGEADSAKNALLDSLAAQLDKLQTIEDLRSRMSAQFQQLQRDFDDIKTAVVDLQLRLAGVKTALVDMDACMSIGRFRDQLVEVTIAATPTAPFRGTAPAAAKPADSGAASGQPAGQPASAGGADVIESKVSFEVYQATHVHVKLGVAVSMLEDPKFELKTVTDNCPQDKQCVQPRQTEKNPYQIRPVAFVGIPLPARYLFAESDPDDPYEDAGKYRYVPFPFFGISITNPTENYYFGGGVDISRGISVNLGMHLGKVLRLQKDYPAGQRIDLPTGVTPDINSYTEHGFHPGFFFSLAIDSRAITKIFSGGNKSNP